MIRYAGTVEQDAVLAQWWAQLHTSGEFPTTFMHALTPIGAFLAYWRRADIILFFDADDRGIRFATWFEPLMSSVCLGLWVREDARRTRGSYDQLYNVLDAATLQWPSVIAATCQPHVAKMLTKLGFVSLGEIPGLWDGQSSSVAYITLARWTNVRRRKERREYGGRSREPLGATDAVGRDVPEPAVRAG